MKKPIVILFLFFIGKSVMAQRDSVYQGRSEPRNTHKKEKNDAWRDHVTFGGNFQAWFGNSTFILLTPTIGFIPFNNFNVGIGAIYNYTSKDFGIYGKYSQSIFGGHSYARYLLGENYFVQTQFDKLYQPNLLSADPRSKTWINYWLVGGGFRQSGDKVAVITSLMYNLTPHPLSIYQSRIIVQFGIVFTP